VHAAAGFVLVERDAAIAVFFRVVPSARSDAVRAGTSLAQSPSPEVYLQATGNYSDT